MFKFAHYLLGAGVLLGASAATAGDLVPDSADGIMNACRGDYHRLCSEIVPGDGRAARCMIGHKMELSPGCRSAIEIATNVEACMPDYQKLCQGVAKGPQAFHCLSERMERLAPTCQRVVSANLPYMEPRAQRYGYNGSPAPYPDAQGSSPYPQGPSPYSQGPSAYSQNPFPYGYLQNPGRPYVEREPNPYAYREAPPEGERYAGEGEPPREPEHSYGYGQPPQYGERYAEEGPPRFRSYDDRYGFFGSPPEGPSEPYVEREPR
jgi:hypothetical protein